MKVTHKGREYELPSDMEELKILAETPNPMGNTPFRYCPPTGRLFFSKDLDEFKRQFPQALNRDSKKISKFINAVFQQVINFCITDKEGVLLSDDLGVLLIGKYKHNRKYLINKRTGEIYRPLINGDYLLRAYWLKPDIKEFRPLHMYKFARDRILIRKASELFHNGKMDYDVIRDTHRLTNDLMQISIMKQKYDAPFK